MNNTEKGKLGEKAALAYLKNNNYEILDKNYRLGRYGEIDIIASEKEYICFIEVKLRKSLKYGYPREAVNYLKQRKIIKIANSYLVKNRIFDKNIRFDVIEVYLDNNNAIKDINIIKNAF